MESTCCAEQYGVVGDGRLSFQSPRRIVSPHTKLQAAGVRPAGKCIFCGGTGVTDEHLFSDWLRELFPRTAEHTHTYGKTVTWPEYKLRSKQGHSGTKKVRKVCRPCNNGWISRIDENAKPVAMRLIQGAATTLTTDMQQALAPWLSKIAMVGDAIEASEAYVSQDDRNYLRDNSKPPERWHVWIGSYAGTAWRELTMYQYRGHLRLPGPPEHSGSYASASTIGMGRLLALVVGHDATAHTIDIGESAMVLKRLWPVSDSFAWPIEPVLSDKDAECIGDVFNSARFV
jgi:hypothetical protein